MFQILGGYSALEISFQWVTAYFIIMYNKVQAQSSL